MLVVLSVHNKDYILILVHSREFVLFLVLFFFSLHEKLDLHQIYSVQIWCKKVQTKVK